MITSDTEGKKKERTREEKTREKQERDCALKRLGRGGVCIDVNLRSAVVYVERGFW